MKKPMTQTRFRTKEGKTRGGSGRKSEHLRLKTRARKKTDYLTTLSSITWTKFHLDSASAQLFRYCNSVA